MNRTSLSPPLGVCAMALLPVLAFGTRFKVDTRLKLGGGYFASAGTGACGEVSVDRAAYGVLAGDVAVRYGVLLARASAALAVGHYLPGTDSHNRGKTVYMPTGILRVGLDRTDWALEVGVAVSPLVARYPMPSLAGRFGPKRLHLLVGWIDQNPMGLYYPLPVEDLRNLTIVVLPQIGLGSETDQWSARLLFSVPAPAVTASLVWKIGRLGIGGELGFACWGSQTFETEDGTLRFGPEDNLATYLFLVLSYSR